MAWSITEKGWIQRNLPASDVRDCKKCWRGRHLHDSWVPSEGFIRGILWHRSSRLADSIRSQIQNFPVSNRKGKISPDRCHGTRQDPLQKTQYKHIFLLLRRCTRIQLTLRYKVVPLLKVRKILAEGSIVLQGQSICDSLWLDKRAMGRQPDQESFLTDSRNGRKVQTSEILRQTILKNQSRGLKNPNMFLAHPNRRTCRHWLLPSPGR